MENSALKVGTSATNEQIQQSSNTQEYSNSQVAVEPQQQEVQQVENSQYNQESKNDYIDAKFVDAEELDDDFKSNNQEPEADEDGYIVF